MSFHRLHRQASWQLGFGSAADTHIDGQTGLDTPGKQRQHVYWSGWTKWTSSTMFSGMYCDASISDTTNVSLTILTGSLNTIWNLTNKHEALKISGLGSWLFHCCYCCLAQHYETSPSLHRVEEPNAVCWTTDLDQMLPAHPQEISSCKRSKVSSSACSPAQSLNADLPLDLDLITVQTTFILQILQRDPGEMHRSGFPD
ncbi:hypothetical protein CHARACLAT_032941 [Characodon lateralis]|uniref:Uncharacterized protein n=1 Tax=Characodon lateralis TaxID=208331 RepID=A0ABU7F205_9TELE|nr:hypothetical protein [Characodon lateralis]